MRLEKDFGETKLEKSTELRDLQAARHSVKYVQYDCWTFETFHVFQGDFKVTAILITTQLNLMNHSNASWSTLNTGNFRCFYLLFRR